MEDADPTVPTPDTADESADDGATAATNAPLPVSQEDHEVAAGTSVGRYIVLSPIGKGGAGVVYAAFDPRLDRKIALKLVQPSPRGHERLLREAQALAQLSHPNVVAVHDVGAFGERVFVAMELVDGWTLRQWQRAERRPWRDVLRMYLQAGAGLEAAHGRGLIHRDFKSDNVLVGRDGSVRVVDFGLVLRADSLEDSAARSQNRTPLDRPKRAPHAITSDDAVGASTPDTRPDRPSRADAATPLGSRDGQIVATPVTGAAAEPLTHVGAILGTPGYMAPEQYRGERTDARTDQFSFCAALYEGLYGQRAFEGRTVGELRASTCSGKIRSPDRRRGVPMRIYRVLERGLSVDPERRWPSMTELLAALRRDPGKVWRRSAVAAAALGSVAAATAIAIGARGPGDVCGGAEALAARAWNPTLDARVADAFTATGLPHAARAHEAISAALNDFTRRWAVMRHDACVATRVRGDQSEAVLTLRMACLDGQLDEAGAFAALMSRGGVDVVQRAVEAATRVPVVDRCADVPALLEPTAIPSDPAARARVGELRRRLADARAQVSAGAYGDAMAALTPLANEARATGYLPLYAEALVDLGRAQIGAGDYARAEDTLIDAEQVADEGRHDTVRAAAVLERVEVTGRWLGHYDQAERAARAAAHLARRVNDRELQWAALDAASRVHGYLARLGEAVAEGKQAIALAEELFGKGDLRVARSHGAVSIALAELGRFDEAEAEDRLALTISERALGETHPSLVRLMTNVATDLTWAGRAAEALPLAQRAESLATRALGDDHPQHGLALNMLGYIQNALGHHQEALDANTRSLAIYERHGGADNVETVYPLVGIGESWLGLGQPERALPILERATRLAEQHGLDPETMGSCHYQLGRAVLLARRDRARALELVQKAVADYGRAPRLAKQRQAAEAWLAAERR